MTMANSKDRNIPNISSILRDHKDTNSKPYRKAIENLIKIGEWKKEGKGWVYTRLGCNLGDFQKKVVSIFSKERINDSIKTGDLSLGIELGEHYTNNPKELIEELSKESGYQLMRGFILGRMEAIGQEKCKEEIEQIFNEKTKKKYKTNYSFIKH